MRRGIDLTKQRFNKLVALRRDEAQLTYWICECNCGRICKVTTHNLTHGKVKSCGKCPRTINLTGKFFGRLQVIKNTSLVENSDSMWECKCICGTTTVVKYDYLVQGHTKSCGCLREEMRGKMFYKDLTGKRFNRLLVIERAGRKWGHTMWRCLCDCGNISEVNSQSLQDGRTQSCGCLWKESITKHGKSTTREYRNLQDRKRREKENELDSKWSFEMDICLREFQSYCAICGMTEEEHIEKYGRSLHIDHVFPLSKGFGLEPGNAVMLCMYHNGSKHNKDLKDLPLDWQTSLIWNAFKFSDYWTELNM